jgi:hypothetical protein
LPLEPCLDTQRIGHQDGVSCSSARLRQAEGSASASALSPASRVGQAKNDATPHLLLTALHLAQPADSAALGA